MKILDDIEVKVGRWAIAAVAIVLVILLLVAHFVWHRRNPVHAVAPIASVPGNPAAVTPSRPTPRPVAAVAQAAAATSTHVHITIHRWPHSWSAVASRRRAPARVNGGSGTSSGMGAGSDSSSATPDTLVSDSPPIEIDVTTTSTATSSASATASAPIATIPVQASMVPTHGRVGMLAATVPAILALDIQALQLHTPWWLVGQPIELSLDAEANLAEVGAGISVGSKAFVEAGGDVSYSGRERGIYIGGGLRF